LYLPKLLVTPATTVLTTTVAASIWYHLLLLAETSCYSSFNPNLAATFKQMHQFKVSESLELKYKIAKNYSE
jgi:hypothetical protein